MKALFYFFALACFIFTSLPGYAQELPGHESALEMLATQKETEPENDEYLLQLSFLKDRKLNVNTVSQEQLSVFAFLNPLQVQSFLQYRLVFGPFRSKYELQAVPGWDINTIHKLLPFLSFTNDLESSASWKDRVSKGQSQLLLRIGAVVEKSKGFQADSLGHKKYAGDPSRIFFRYTYQYKQQFLWGITGEKDPGEGLGGKAGIDFTGFHMLINRGGLFKTIALGDYVLNIGQGLTQWQGLALGKTGDPVSVFRQGSPLSSYRSAGEWNFHRGVAGVFQFRNFELTMFISHRRLSGNVSGDSSNTIVSSLSESGYHRTAGELADRKSVRMFCGGANLEYRVGKLQAGINVLAYRFSLPFLPAAEPYNYYAFRGDKLLNLGGHYNYQVRNAFLFGELAIGYKGLATIQGMILNLHRKVDVSVIYRNIQPGYKAFFASALTEGSNVNNESGFYFGLKFIPNARWSVSAYTDHFRFPWLRFRADAPSGGREYFMEVNRVKKRFLNTSVRIRFGENPENNSSNVINRVLPKRTVNVRLHAERILNSQLVLASRFDFAGYVKGSQRQSGFAAYADVKYQLLKPPLAFSLRYQFFNTDGYESRIYAYERDVLFTYSIPSFFDKGLRYYLQIQGKLPASKLFKSLTFSWWVRWAQTLYNNKSSIGSGQDEIGSNHKSDWKCQLIVGWQKPE